MRTAFFAATIAAIGFQQAQALYDQVYTLTDQNFDDYVTNDHENVWVVNYYADWCPHAQSFESDYHRAAEHAKASGYKVKYGAMDAASNYATA
jgi:thioredoxin-like negative regulator of GroEL